MSATDTQRRAATTAGELPFGWCMDGYHSTCRAAYTDFLGRPRVCICDCHTHTTTPPATSATTEPEPTTDLFTEGDPS